MNKKKIMSFYITAENYEKLKGMKNKSLIVNIALDYFFSTFPPDKLNSVLYAFNASSFLNFISSNPDIINNSYLLNQNNTNFIPSSNPDTINSPSSFSPNHNNNSYPSNPDTTNLSLSSNPNKTDVTHPSKTKLSKYEDLL